MLQYFQDLLNSFLDIFRKKRGKHQRYVMRITPDLSDDIDRIARREKVDPQIVFHQMLRLFFLVDEAGQEAGGLYIKQGHDFVPLSLFPNDGDDEPPIWLHQEEPE